MLAPTPLRDFFYKLILTLATTEIIFLILHSFNLDDLIYKKLGATEKQAAIVLFVIAFILSAIILFSQKQL